MEVLCKNCSAKLNIPEDKIPKGQKVRVSCPRCHEKVIIDGTPLEPETAPLLEKSREDQGPLLNPDHDDSEENVILDSSKGGKNLALVMSNNEYETNVLKTSVEELDYRFVPAETPRKAISMMRFNTFDLVIMPDTFNDIPLERNPVLDFLNHLPMSVRRHMIFVLFGESLKSNDRMMGFTMSANVVVNSQDLGKITDILMPAISDHQMLYRIFSNTLEELGKI
jgi:DNA-directed RNA polymerase subunit RPC12/RpoP